jgi:signal transduction histidine kinase
VHDEGLGIAREDQARLFSDNPGLRNEPTGGEKSTGMGLTIVRKIIEEHKGTLTVESEVGAGSTFSFTLPLEGKRVE